MTKMNVLMITAILNPDVISNLLIVTITMLVPTIVAMKNEVASTKCTAVMITMLVQMMIVILALDVLIPT